MNASPKALQSLTFDFSSSPTAWAFLQDDAFVRYAPMAARWLGRITPLGRELPAWLLRRLVKLTQNTAERKNRKIRLDTLKHDQQRREQMGFAGNKG